LPGGGADGTPFAVAQSNTGLFVSARPLVMQARADSLLARRRWHNHKPSVPISGPPPTVRWPSLLALLSRANKQTRAGVKYSSHNRRGWSRYPSATRRRSIQPKRGSKQSTIPVSISGDTRGRATVLPSTMRAGSGQDSAGIGTELDIPIGAMMSLFIYPAKLWPIVISIWHDARFSTEGVTVPGIFRVLERNEVSTSCCRGRCYSCGCQSAAGKQPVGRAGGI